MIKNLALLFLIVLLIPFIVSMILVEKIVNSNFEEILLNRAGTSYKTSSEILDNFLSEASVKTRISIRDTEIQALVKENNSMDLIDRITLLQDDLNLKKWGAGIEIYNSKGVLLASTFSKNSAGITKKEIVSSALEGILIEKVFQDTPKTDSLTAAVTAFPVYTKEKSEPIGVLSLLFPLSDFLADHLAAITGTHLLFCTENDSVFIPFASSLFIKGKRITAPLRLDYSSNGEKLFSSEQIYKEYYIYSPSNKKSYNNFQIITLADKKIHNRIVSSTRKTLLIITVITLLAALTGAFIFTGINITGPVKRLVCAAGRLEKGNFNEPVAINSKDEFAYLAQTFESMRLEIKATINQLDLRVKELSLLDEINRSLVQYRDETAVKEVLAVLCRAMNAQRCSILMMDKNLQELTLKMVHTPHKAPSQSPEQTHEQAHEQAQDQIHEPAREQEPAREYITFKPGQGLAGIAAQTGEIQYSGNAQSDERFKEYPQPGLQSGALKIKNLVCIPLVDNKECLGVINIADSNLEFTGPVIKVLENAAHQISTAMQKARLYELAITDGMTGLFIHRYFQARLETELQRSRRYKLSTGLIMFDIDHFKKFNDTWGHQLGDTVLKRVAAMLKQGIREGIDIPARYGGEEFAVIMPEACIEDAVFVAKRLRKMVEQDYIMHEGSRIQVTISLGCAVFPDNADNKDDLIKAADKALYAAKEGGRNMVSRA
jgi:diguanylate cyclase (GGDEF)-like protein